MSKGGTSGHIRTVLLIFRELARERAWSRIYLAPLLLAEFDRDTYRRERASTLREELLMKNVPGFEVCSWESERLTVQPGKSVYNTKRYTPNNFVVM